MKKYTFVVTGGISLHVDVEAGSMKKAIEKAKEASVQGLCNQCASSIAGEWSTSGEIDCEPATGELSAVYVDDEDVQGAAFFDLQRKWSEG